MTYRRGWTEGVLAMAALLLLAAPAAVVRQRLRPEPWTPYNLRVQFESMRFERAALVFTYRLENRTRRSARLLPDRTQIRVMQPGGEPPIGYPVMRLPLAIEPHEVQHIEVRLELAAEHEPLTPRQSEEQTARVLRHKLPNVRDLDSPLSPLPMTQIPSTMPADSPVEPPAFSIATMLAHVLTALNGFEIDDPKDGIHIAFPRGW